MNSPGQKWGHYQYVFHWSLYVFTYGRSSLASAKAGVIAFTKAIAKEVGQYKIRVNAIAPSVI